MFYYSFTFNLSTFFVLFFIFLNVAYCDHRRPFFGPSPFPMDPMDPLLSALLRSGTFIICTDPDLDPSVYKQKIMTNLFLQYWDFLATCYLDTGEKGPDL
jgi:hypothetical protein